MAHAKSTDPNVFILPDLGEGVHEAEMIKWRVSEGDTVAEHDILAEMETDKALVEVPSPRAGTIKTLHGSEGEILNVGNPLVTYEGGADAPAAEPAKPAKQAAAASNNGSAPAEDEDAGTVVGKMGDAIAGITARAGKALAAPAVRRLARDLGVEIDKVLGTGIAGRVTAKDVRDAAEGKGQSRPAANAPAASASAPSAEAKPAATQQHQPQQRTWAPPAGGQPSYPQQPAPQMMPQQGYAQPQAQAMPGYGYPPQYQQMPYAYMPMPMPYPMMPMPMPGYGGQPGQAGVPHAPGYTPAGAPRPIPNPAQQAAFQGGEAEASVPFRGVRRTIAQRLRESVDTAVHFTVVDEADVTNLDAYRRQLAQQTGEKISFLPFVCAAIARSLSARQGGRFGALNARVDDAGEQIVQHAGVHLGIATDTDSGLMVPVISDADQMDVVTLARSIASTAKAARDRSIERGRLMGSTFTISNVGSHAGKFATPVINYPEVAILAVGRVSDAVVVREGQAMVGKTMPLSLACDHRVVDGATAALCLAEVVRTLEDGIG